MFVAYVTVTLIAIAAYSYAVAAALFRFGFVRETMGRVGVPELWLPSLGAIKAAGVAGLILGLAGVPIVGELAAAGFIGFFLGRSRRTCAHATPRWRSRPAFWCWPWPRWR